MNRFLLALLLTFLFLSSDAQEDALKWINKNAVELQNEPSAKDYAFLQAELKGNTVIGLGEASHGTREFYQHKRYLIEYLVTEMNYKLLGFEFDHEMIEGVNQYLQQGTGDLKALMANYRLYNVKEIYELFSWLKDFNAGQPEKEKVTLFGFDNREYWADPYTRDEYMARDAIAIQEASKKKAILWAHNVHIAKDTTMANYPGLGVHLKKHYGQQLYMLGFDTFKGEVSILNDVTFETHAFEGLPGTYSALFAKALQPRFFISFKQTPFRGHRNKITHIGSNWTENRALPMKPGVDFDGLVFIRTSSATMDLSAEQ